MATRLWTKEYVFLSSLGVPRAFGKVYAYTSNTSSALDTYSDDSRSTLNQNPITLNMVGRLPVDVFLLDADYKFIVTNSDGTDSVTIDPVHGDTSPVTFAFETTSSLLSAFAAGIVLDDGQMAVTSGRDTAGDMGGGSFYYNASDTATADNGGTIRVDAPGRRWYWVDDGKDVSGHLFGVSEDSSDNAAAWDNWRTFCYAAFRIGSLGPGIFTLGSAVKWPSIRGAGVNATQLKAPASFSGTYLLDCNDASGGDKFLADIFLDLRIAPSGVTAFGSSSSGGGGGPARTMFDRINIISSSATVWAVQMSSSESEVGPFINSTWSSCYLEGPRCISVGGSQACITMNSCEFSNGAGGATDPFDFSSDNLTLNSPSFEVRDIPSGAFITVGSQTAVLNNVFFEATEDIEDAQWAFAFLTTGPDADAQARAIVNGLAVNLNYTGADADAALIRINLDSTAATNYGSWVSINSVDKDLSEGTSWPTLFNLYSSSSSATGPTVLHIENCDQYAAISKSATGSTASSSNVKAHLRGHHRGKLLNHTAPAPAAGNALVWTWVVGADFTL